MKRKITYIVSLLMLIGIQTVKGQSSLDEILWSDYSHELNDDVITTDEDITNGTIKYLLLFNRGAALKGDVKRHDAFLSNSGEYGMQGTLSNIGNRFYITKTVDNKGDDVYLIRSNTTNTIEENYKNGMAIGEGTIFMDRSYTWTEGNVCAPNWKFSIDESETGTKPDGSKKYCYFISNDINNDNNFNQYLYFDNTKKLIHYSSEETAKSQWCIILEDEYKEAITKLGANSYVDVTGLLHDGGFNRFNDYEKSWEAVDGDGWLTSVTDIETSELNKTYLESIDQTIADNNTAIEEKKNALSGHAEDLAAIESKNNEIVNKTAEKTAKETAINDAVANKGTLETNEANTIDELFKLTDSTIDDRNAKYDGLKSKMAERDEIQKEIDKTEVGSEERTTLVAKKGEKENEILAYVNNIRPADNQLTDFNVVLNSYNTKENINAQWQVVVAQIGENQTAIGAINADLETLNGELAALKDKLPEGIENLQEEITALEKANSDLATKKEKLSKLLSYKSHVIGAVETERNGREYAGNWWEASPWEFWRLYGKHFSAAVYSNGGYQQTIDHLPAGTYRIVCTGFNSGTNENYGSLVINGKKVPMPLLDDKKAVFDQKKAEVTAKAKTNLWLTDDYYYQGLDNIVAAQVLEENKEAFTVDFYVEITEDQKMNGKNNITFGFSNNNPDAASARDYPVFADNFQVFYTNMTYKAYISANNANEGAIDKYAYEKPVDLYVRRAFTRGAWNSIVLPFDITVGGLAENFGSGAKLSKLVGVNPERPTQIKFENTAELKAGECGLIYVPENAEPIWESTSATTKLRVLASPIVNGTFTPTDKNVYGPLYLIKGASREGNAEGYANIFNDESVTNSIVTKDYTTTVGTLEYTGYFYKKDGEKWKEHSYIMDKGSMYYLSSDWGKVYGTMWSLRDKEPNAGAKVFEINGIVDNTVTEISGIVADNDNTKNNKIYSVSGLYMGDNASKDNLPKGLYIMNGKKFIVK